MKRWERILETSFLVLLFVLALSVLGPMLDKADGRSEFEQAKALEAEQREAQRVARFEKAAYTLCGQENGWFKLAEDGKSIVCVTKRGHVTSRVAMGDLK